MLQLGNLVALTRIKELLKPPIFCLFFIGFFFLMHFIYLFAALPNPAKRTIPWHTPLCTPPTLGSPGYESARCYQEAGQHFLHQDLRSEALFSVGNLDNLPQAQHSLENLSQLQVKKKKKITHTHTIKNAHASFRKLKQVVISTKHKELWQTS